MKHIKKEVENCLFANDGIYWFIEWSYQILYQILAANLSNNAFGKVRNIHIYEKRVQ